MSQARSGLSPLTLRAPDYPFRFYGLYSESYKVISQRNYLGAYAYTELATLPKLLIRSNFLGMKSNQKNLKAVSTHKMLEALPSPKPAPQAGTRNPKRKRV